MAELADVQDLGSCAARRAGSTPVTRTSREPRHAIRVRGSLFYNLILASGSVMNNRTKKRMKAELSSVFYFLPLHSPFILLLYLTPSPLNGIIIIIKVIFKRERSVIMKNKNESGRNKPLYFLFPLLELIPFIFFIPTYILSTTPNNILYEQDLQEISFLMLPASILVAIFFFVFGLFFLIFHHLHGVIKWSTLILTIIHGAIVLCVIVFSVWFAVILFSGNSSV